MKGRLILLSKERSEFPTIDRTRPISVLPAIIKLFESSVLHNFEKATSLPVFSKSQMGFMKGRSTLHNINELLMECEKLQSDKRSNKNLSPCMVFFDLAKAYDRVPRKLIFQKLLQFGIPSNVIETIKHMLENFTLSYRNAVIHPKRKLVQGSVLSPSLFNLFTNDLLVVMEMSNIKTLTYADDIVCICMSITQAKQAINIMKEWAEIDQIEVNKKKSGILRILNRRGKVGTIPNSLNIPEVYIYQYLSVARCTRA
jgi:hypothetical protein